jgi:hypothetical protein
MLLRRGVLKGASGRGEVGFRLQREHDELTLSNDARFSYDRDPSSL